MARAVVRSGGVSAALVAATLLAPQPASADVFDAVAAGAYAHSLNNSPGGRQAGTTEAEMEVDTERPPVFRATGSPRVAVTAAANGVGEANFTRADLVWDHRLWRQLSETLQLGLDANDGATRAPVGRAGSWVGQHRLELGSQVFIRKADGLNWGLNDRWELGPMYAHNPNGEVLSKGPNESSNAFGVRLGYRLK
jgi:hypothetical protein